MRNKKSEEMGFDVNLVSVETTEKDVSGKKEVDYDHPTVEAISSKDDSTTGGDITGKTL